MLGGLGGSKVTTVQQASSAQSVLLQPQLGRGNFRTTVGRKVRRRMSLGMLLPLSWVMSFGMTLGISSEGNLTGRDIFGGCLWGCLWKVGMSLEGDLRGRLRGMALGCLRCWGVNGVFMGVVFDGCCSSWACFRGSLFAGVFWGGLLGKLVFGDSAMRLATCWQICF